MITHTTRREFFKFLAAGAVVAVVPVSIAEALSSDLPLILGDGKHNDVLGIQAAIDGRPFIARDDCVTVEYYIVDGIPTRTIVFKKGTYFVDKEGARLFDQVNMLKGEDIRRRVTWKK